MGGDRTRQVALGLLIFFIGASALAFGSVELWAREWLRLGALATLALVLWTVPVKEVLGGVAGRLALPVALVAVWGLIQVAPLPGSLVGAVSPRTSEIHRDTVPPAGGHSLHGWLLEKAGDEGIRIEEGATLPPGPPDSGAFLSGRSLSLYPYATWRATLAWVTPILFYLVTAWVARSDLARYRLLWAIAAWAGIFGLIAVLQTITWNGEILWIRPRPSGTAPLGPFVSPTHYAGYVEMATLATLGLALALLSRPTGKLNLGGIRAALLDRDWTLPRVFLLSGLATLGVAGLLISGSEGGYLAFGAGLVALFLAKRLRGAIVVLAVAVVIVGVAVGLVSSLGPGSAEPASVPLASSELSPSFLLRLDAWASTLEMFEDFPVTGTGLGTFEWAFAGYQREGEWLSWADAHNDYLQVLAEAGLIGAALLVWALWVFIRHVLRPALAGSRNGVRWTTAATAAAVFAMLIHSIVDFNLQTPSNALLFAILLGILTAAAQDAKTQRGPS
jgi:O-antigen ligase